LSPRNKVFINSLNNVIVEERYEKLVDALGGDIIDFGRRRSAGTRRKGRTAEN
jgi:hypothetical protein